MWVHHAVKGPEFPEGKFPWARISAFSGPQIFCPWAGISGVSQLERTDFKLRL
jgi:hypothetical protein